MPDGATLPANNNPYLDASFAKHLGYSWLIWEPLAHAERGEADHRAQAVAGHQVGLGSRLQLASR